MQVVWSWQDSANHCPRLICRFGYILVMGWTTQIYGLESKSVFNPLRKLGFIYSPALIILKPSIVKPSYWFTCHISTEIFNYIDFVCDCGNSSARLGQKRFERLPNNQKCWIVEPCAISLFLSHALIVSSPSK